MSGVYGAVSARDDGPLDGAMADMALAMNHLPWYQVEHRCFDPGEVGLGRVGIGIFNAETQPVSSVEDDVHLVMAGEFYYTDELHERLKRHSRAARSPADSELALQLYLEFGADFIHQVEGLFSLAIWDGRSQALELFNDRFGLKPLYYAHWNHRFLFAPEMKGILTERRFPRNLNLTATAEFVRFQQVLGNKTFFQDIELLPPASRLTYRRDQNQFRIRCYWDWRELGSVQPFNSVEEATEEVGRLLHRSVEERFRRVDRLGVFLSGGLDSRGLVAAAGKKAQGLPTLTYGHPESRDMRLAAKVARLARTKHYEFPIQDSRWLLDAIDLHLSLVEGQHTWTNAHGMAVLPRARELFEVCLTGVGAIILSSFTVTPTMAEAPDHQAFVAAMADFYLNRHSWPSLSEYEAMRVYGKEHSKELQGLALKSLEGELAALNHHNRALGSLFFNIQNHDRRLIAGIITYKNSHIENRLPYYDYSLVELGGHLRPEWRPHRAMKWRYLQRFAPRFALIPHDKDLRLPTENVLLRRLHSLYVRSSRALREAVGRPIADRTLHTDFESDLRGVLKDWAESIVLDERTLSRGIFSPEALRSMFDRHMSGNEVHTIGKLAPIMTYEMVLRRFID
jgi:asparagine synthase (glutamine-hydrolysing)